MIARLSRKLVTALTVVAFMVASGLVLAQDAPPADAGPPAAGPTETEVEETPADSELDVPMRKKAQISPRDMATQGANYLAKMREILKRIVELQEIARRNKDVIKLNCVNDKLLQVKQLLNIGEAASKNMEAAVSRRDEEGRYHEFGRMTIAYQQVSVLGTEAENCIGEDLSFLGPTEVTVEEPEQPDDPTAEPTPEFPVVEPPPVASPFS